MSSGKSALLQKHDDDVVIVAALRTAITKGRKGGFKDTQPEEYLAAVLKAVYTQVKLDPKLIDDIAVGNVLPPGGGASAARMAALYAGIPNTTPINTINRQCSSGLAAVQQIANEIRAGEIDIGIGAGVESMTSGFGASAMPSKFSDAVLANQESADCLIPMGMTSENVAADYNISRQTQDKFAAESFQKAARAQKAQKFKREIVPVTVKWADPKTEEEREIVVNSDDGIRDDVTEESLGKLKPAFMKGGTTTAGNASQVSDGAAAVLLMRRSVAKKLGLTVLAKFVVAQAVGVPPRIMGVGPAFAIPKALAKAGISVKDVDFWEINEAFASQAVYSIQTLKIPFERVNLYGGGISIGHPLGATGARQIATGLTIAKDTGAKVFVTSMCIGSGMGMAAVLVSEQ